LLLNLRCCFDAALLHPAGTLVKLSANKICSESGWHFNVWSKRFI